MKTMKDFSHDMEEYKEMFRDYMRDIQQTYEEEDILIIASHMADILKNLIWEVCEEEVEEEEERCDEDFEDDYSDMGYDPYEDNDGYDEFECGKFIYDEMAANP